MDYEANRMAYEDNWMENSNMAMNSESRDRMMM